MVNPDVSVRLDGRSFPLKLDDLADEAVRPTLTSSYISAPLMFLATTSRPATL